MAKTKQEIIDLKQENDKLIEENDRLKQSNKILIDELKNCHLDISQQIDVLTRLKKDMLSYEVQLESMTAENLTLKARMGKIENNPIGKIALQTYRNLRDLKSDIKNVGKKDHTKPTKIQIPSAISSKKQIVQTLEKYPAGKVALKLYRNAKSIAKVNTK